MDVEWWWNENRQGKTKVFGEASATVLGCPPQILHKLPELNLGLCSKKVVTDHLHCDSYNSNVRWQYVFLLLSGPRACYDEGKRVAETLSYAYAKQEKVDVRVARIFNTFGPRMHMNDGRVVSNFILQALKNEPITVRTSC